MSEIPKIARARLARLGGLAAGPDAAGGSHPDADQLTAFLERSLGAREREQVLEHLVRCAECREVVAVALPPEEAERAAQPAQAGRPAPGLQWFEWPAWGGLRWAAVAATFAIAVTLVFQSYRQTPEMYSRKAAENRPVAAESPAEKPAAPGRADEVQAPKVAPATPSATAPASAPPSSTAIVALDGEARGARGPSKLDAVTRAKAEQKSGELARVFNGRLEDDKQARAANVETGTGTVGGKVVAGAPASKAAPSAPAPALAAEAKRGPAAPAAQQQQVAGLARQSGPPSPPATKEELHGQAMAAAEPSHAAADRAESVQVSGQNEVVSAENAEKDAPPKAGARNVAPAREAFEAAVPLSKAAATMRWVISGEGLVQRSMDNGSTWRSVRLDTRIRFRAVSATGSEVWAGGEGGALYHSSDSGSHWTRVALPAELASATIVRVEFPDARHGTLATSTGESWATSDSGASWHKK